MTANGIQTDTKGTEFIYRRDILHVRSSVHRNAICQLRASNEPRSCAGRRGWSSNYDGCDDSGSQQAGAPMIRLTVPYALGNIILTTSGTVTVLNRNGFRFTGGSNGI